VARVHEIVELLTRAGVHARLIATTKPGYIIFEDDYQIAALPFRDTRHESQVDDFLID
jgi:hypothetical protein